MIRWLYLFLLFGLPFLVVRQFALAYEPPKVIAAETIIVIMAGLAIGKQLTNRQLIRGNPLFYLTIILGLLGVFHLLFDWTATTMFGNPFRLQGTILLFLLAVSAWLANNLPLERIPVFVKVFSLFAIVVTTMAAAETLGGRSVGTLGEPNAMAAQVIFFGPLVWFAQIKDRLLGTIFRILTIFAMLIVLFYTDSRAGMIAMTLETLIIVLWSAPRLPKWAVVGIAAIGLSLSLFLPFHDSRTVYENRQDVWQVAFAAGFAHPMLGAGFGNIEEALHQTAVRLNNPVWYQYVDSSHNIFLDWWVSGGVIGLGIFVGFISTALVQLTKDRRLPELVILFGLLAVLSFNPASVTSLLALWWMLGLALIRKKITPNDQKF